MSVDQAQPAKAALPSRQDDLARRLRATSWGLFFVWIGVAVLADLRWAWSLFGIGAIILGEQAARARFNLRLNGLWIACGIVFVIGGLWEVFHFNWPLAPVMLILLGLGILWNGLLGRGARGD